MSVSVVKEGKSARVSTAAKMETIWADSLPAVLRAVADRLEELGDGPMMNDEEEGEIERMYWEDVFFTAGPQPCDVEKSPIKGTGAREAWSMMFCY